jgi:predicted short-subunit dehydrogenase-like oxidoreductase (DUF2520 family)
MRTAAALDPLSGLGAVLFSFHPLQTFPRDFHPAEILPTARGICYAVDGDPRAIRKARTLARALEGFIVEIPPAKRELYHAACVVASNHLTTMLAVVEEMYGALGGHLPAFSRAFMPIVSATVGNIARTSPAAALSGPVARGGVETVGRHFEALRTELPHLLPYFAAVSRETIRLALRKGSVSEEQAERMRTLVASFESHSSQHPENR